MSKLKAIAVIGANYGDEGKGLVTDSLVNLHGSSLVVRFNGGAQAGHTVVTPDGRRHVFHHIGAGALSGADTYLSKFFVCKPGLFNAEFKRLLPLHEHLPNNIYVNRNCLITTPWDEIINQFLEIGRGAIRHGSVGVGFGETIERSENPDFRLRIMDLLNAADLGRVLSAIIRGWFPQRLKALHKLGEFSRLSDELLTKLKHLVRNPEPLVTEFVQQCREFIPRIQIVGGMNMQQGDAPIIFEGAQGLLLDQNSGGFPHVTRSNTGIENVVRICREEDWVLDEVVYVTRHYATRHGAGPFPLEGTWGGVVDDPTNVPNTYQQTLRTGTLDWTALLRRTFADYGLVSATVQRSIALTHCDNIQFPYHMRWSEHQSFDVDEVDFESAVKNGWDKAYLGYGPSRANLKVVGTLAVDPSMRNRNPDTLW